MLFLINKKLNTDLIFEVYLYEEVMDTYKMFLLNQLLRHFKFEQDVIFLHIYDMVRYKQVS